MKTERKIHVGIILGAHGVQGDVRLRSLTVEPESIFTFKTLADESGKQEFRLKRKGLVKGDFIVSLRGVTDRNAAEALRGTKLFVDRSALPEARKGEFYEVDLIDLVAKDKDGKSYGKVLALHDFGAGAFLEIQPAQGASFMLPFTDDYVPSVEIEKGSITIIVPDGWLSPDKKPPQQRARKT